MVPKARFFTRLAALAYGALLVGVSAPAGAAISLSNSPLFLTVTMPPNITLTLDDSGSMSRAWVPEVCPGTGDIRDCSALDNRYGKSSAFNLLYYNPKVKYPAPKQANGTTRTTSFTAAYRNGFDTDFSTTQDLRTRYRPTASLFLQPGEEPSEEYMGHYSGDVRCNNGLDRCEIKSASGSWVTGASSCPNGSNPCVGAGEGTVPPRMPAYYYNFNAGLPNCNGQTNDNDCYSIVIVSSTSGPGGVDLDGDGVTVGDNGDKDERQNFANWYSFARTRNLATVTAASLSFSTLDSSARIAWQGLNTCRGGSNTLVTTDCDGWKQNTSFSNSIGTYNTSQKTDFYSWLAQLPTNGGTPLPQAMNRVGAYYSTTGENSPYDNNFATSNSGQHACRRNFHIMMTDGIWNDAVSSFSNADNTNTELPEPTKDLKPNVTDYFARSPYKDDYSNTLADVAFSYWVRDLANLKNIVAPVYNDRAGLDDQVRYWNAKNDPATWQHMVNYTIGLGLSGYLKQVGLTWDGDTYTGSYSALVAGTKTWPNANSNDQNPANVADLWHAALNSRGQFFSADDPASLSQSFEAALTSITGSNGSAASLSANSTSARTGSTRVYQARFNRDWSGTLLALPITGKGVVLDKVWDAGELMPAHQTRRIFTRNDTAGVDFLKCDDLSTEMRTRLNQNASGLTDNLCEKRLAWLRGDTKDEQRFTGGVLRNRPPSDENPARTKILGDIINSDPAYVEHATVNYALLPTDTPGQEKFAKFEADIKSRNGMLYVGANDGMLHGFLASSGVEQFAFIPSGITSTLARLTDPNYVHRYYVDGGITAGDAYVIDKWKTLVVAGLNGGGRTVYALDVTDPTSFDGDNLMWEFTDPDMGLSFSQPQIGVTESGDWVAIFGNGYNSPRGTAHLYVVRLSDGSIIRKFDVGPALLADNENGLSTPVAFDSDPTENHRIDAVYAGDLQGNLWKFDLSGATSADWTVAFGGTPLFTAIAPAVGVTPARRQPITSQPTVADHPNGGHMVMFGTGRYLAMSDVTDTGLQSYYGIRDFKGGSGSLRANLQVQTIVLQQVESGREVRAMSSAVPDWSQKSGWYLDLVDPGPTRIGERVVSGSVIVFDRVVFITIIPSVDPCVPGGVSWLMELSIANGGGFQDSILDVNGDGKVDDKDKANTGDGDAENDTAVGGGKLDSNVGLAEKPIVLECEDGLICKDTTGTGGGFGEDLNKGEQPDPEEEDEPVHRRSWIQIR
jgi:type IV pilus assembly protein PilY1